MSTDAERGAERIRDRERTRRAVLTAAERIFAERGTGAAIADVAREAGVSKSGLLHHFPSREELIGAVVADVIAKSWEEIHALVDPADDRPGAFTRGYLRAMTGDSPYLSELFSASGLIAHLGTTAALGHLEGLEHDDAARLRAAFDADGLPPGRAAAVRYAAEGIALSLNTPYLTESQRLEVRAELFALTEL